MSTGAIQCKDCGLPRFYGAYGYAGAQCQCQWRLSLPSHWTSTDARIADLERQNTDLRAAIARLPVYPAFDFHSHLSRQAKWAEETFGPGMRTNGLCEHIRKELLEIEADPSDLKEWIDVVILGLDGAWRCGGSPQQIIATLVAKQTKNEGRNWPDWRTADPNKPIEHDRTGEIGCKSGDIGTQPDTAAVRDAAQKALVELEGLNDLDTETECVTIAVTDEIEALRSALQSTTATPPDSDAVRYSWHLPCECRPENLWRCDYCAGFGKASIKEQTP